MIFTMESNHFVTELNCKQTENGILQLKAVGEVLKQGLTTPAHPCQRSRPGWSKLL